MRCYSSNELTLDIQYMTHQNAHYNKDTISIHLVHEALLVAHQKGLNTQSVLINSGIPLELLNTSKARVSVSQYAKLWVELANLMNDEFFGIDSHPMRRGSFKFLAKSAMHNETVEKALQHILQFLNVVLDDFNSQLFVQENYAYIIIYDQKNPKRMFSYATYLIFIHGLMCWLSRQRVFIQQIQLKCDAPLDDHDYKVRFCENIQYNSDENYIQFDANYLNITIKQDSSSWHQFIQNTPQNLLVRFKNPNAISTQLRKYLIKYPPSNWLELNEIAQYFNMSNATIQRRLKSEGVSYQQLKNDIRCDMAIDFLTNTSKTLQDISHLLNFHDPSAFHRAFKKWTGVSPGAYRQHQEQ